MTIEVFKKLGSKEQYEYLKNLDYQPCNLPNVGVHYGDVRSICLNGKSSAYISEGHVKSFTEQNAVNIIENDIPINQPTEVNNETTKTMYLILDGCMLLDEKVGDYTIHIRRGIDPDLKKILDKWKRIVYIDSIVNKRERINYDSISWKKCSNPRRWY